MIRLLSIRPAATADLADARAWYQDQRPGLGNEFLLAIADALTQVEEGPERFPGYYKDFRRALVERFPYKIFFRIEEDAVVVMRVLHAARDHRNRLRRS